MIHEILPLWYGEAEPDGSWAGLVPEQHVLTDKGIVPLCPNGNTLFLRKRGSHLACQGQSGDNWLWDGSSWTNIGPSYGVSPVAFAPDGSVVQNTPAFGSQGIRWIDEAGVHTGDATYVAPAPVSLYEYTTHGDVTIGQGGDGGVMAVTPEGRRVLIPAPTYTVFVRFNRSGDSLAVAVVTKGGLHLMWFTRQELNTFPLEGVAEPPPPPPPPKDPPPPEPTVPVAPNVLPRIQAVFAAHPEVNTNAEGERGKITDYVVQDLGGLPWGRKDRDQNPTNNNNSDDALCYLLSDGRFEIYDIIDGTSGGPGFDYKGTFANGENGYFREVGGVTPTPGPKPQPATTLDAIVRSLIEMAVAPLRAEIDALKARPAGGSTSIDGTVIALRSHTEGREYLTQEPNGAVVGSEPGRAFGDYQLWTVEVQ